MQFPKERIAGYTKTQLSIIMLLIEKKRREKGMCKREGYIRKPKGES